MQIFGSASVIFHPTIRFRQGGVRHDKRAVQSSKFQNFSRCYDYTRLFSDYFSSGSYIGKHYMARMGADLLYPFRRNCQYSCPD